MNEKQEFTELEKLYQKTIEKMSAQITDLSINLNMAYAQIDLLKEEQQKNALLEKKNKDKKEAK